MLLELKHIYKNYSVDNFRKEKVKNKLELQMRANMWQLWDLLVLERQR